MISPKKKDFIHYRLAKYSVTAAVNATRPHIDVLFAFIEIL